MGGDQDSQGGRDVSQNGSIPNGSAHHGIFDFSGRVDPSLQRGGQGQREDAGNTGFLNDDQRYANGMTSRFHDGGQQYGLPNHGQQYGGPLGGIQGNGASGFRPQRFGGPPTCDVFQPVDPGRAVSDILDFLFRPYQRRSDVIGPSHGIPGVGILEKHLTPLGWCPGHDPMSASDARETFNEKRNEAAAQIEREIVGEEDLTTEEQESRQKARTKKWEASLVLDTMVRDERCKIAYDWGYTMRRGENEGFFIRTEENSLFPNEQLIELNRVQFSEYYHAMSSAWSARPPPPGGNQTGFIHPSPPNLFESGPMPFPLQELIQNKSHFSSTNRDSDESLNRPLTDQELAMMRRMTEAGYNFGNNHEHGVNPLGRVPRANPMNVGYGTVESMRRGLLAQMSKESQAAQLQALQAAPSTPKGKQTRRKASSTPRKKVSKDWEHVLATMGPPPESKFSNESIEAGKEWAAKHDVELANLPKLSGRKRRGKELPSATEGLKLDPKMARNLIAFGAPLSQRGRARTQSPGNRLAEQVSNDIMAQTGPVAAANVHTVHARGNAARAARGPLPVMTANVPAATQHYGVGPTVPSLAPGTLNQVRNPFHMMQKVIDAPLPNGDEGNGDGDKPLSGANSKTHASDFDVNHENATNGADDEEEDADEELGKNNDSDANSEGSDHSSDASYRP